ncbi:hypothetical protein AVEN_148599-1, partial [Araneus ventricosus]
ASDAAVPSFISLSAAAIIRKSSVTTWIAVLAGYCYARASSATRFYCKTLAYNPGSVVVVPLLRRWVLLHFYP